MMLIAQGTRKSHLRLVVNNTRAVSMKNDPARVISVTSGKGGVGKTHLTVNLGLALINQGMRVLLIDADLGLANINVLLGFQPKKTIKDITSGEAKIRDVIVSHPLGFDIIPASSGVQEMSQLSEQERLMLVNAVDELEEDYDYLLVDTGAGIGDNVLYFNIAAEEIIVVVDEEPTSRTDAYALIKVLSSKHGINEFNIVSNRVPIGKDGRNIYAQLSAATSKFLHVSLKYLGAIAYDPLVSEAIIDQKPFLSVYPSSKASIDITKLAKRIIASERSRAPKGGLQFFFRALLGNSQ